MIAPFAIDLSSIVVAAADDDDDDDIEYAKAITDNSSMSTDEGRDGKDVFVRNELGDRSKLLKCFSCGKWNWTILRFVGVASTSLCTLLPHYLPYSVSPLLAHLFLCVILLFSLY